MTEIYRWLVEDDQLLLRRLAESLRSAGLWGHGNHFGGPDEVILESGGPLTDRDSMSMLQGPATYRFLCRQPEEIPPFERTGSSLDGQLPLVSEQVECSWEVQLWNGSKWVTSEVSSGIDLADSLRRLERYLDDTEGLDIDSPLGGFAGLLTYDMARWTTPLRFENCPEIGDMVGILYRVDRSIVHDRCSGEIRIHASAEDEWALECVEHIEGSLADSSPPFRCKSTTRSFSSTIDDERHAAVVSKVQAAIADGQFYQLNYGRIWKGGIDDPWEIYRSLMMDNPAPMAGWLSVPDIGYVLASASPETLLRIDGETISTHPIKGTRPRARTRDRDEANKRELIATRKEVCEHMMLVDLERNDIGRVSEAGSVDWEEWRIESHPNVHHLVSDVTGRLRSDLDGWDALAALFPGGSITGCPKVATMAAIDELEHAPRGAWTGSLGYHNPISGKAGWNILIRTMEARCSTDGWEARIQAGGGLVFDSDPEQEVEEAKWKAQALLQAAWGGGETEVPRGEMNYAAVPSLDELSAALLESQSQQRPVCLAPANPIVWHHGDPPLPAPPLDSRRVLFVDNLDSFSWNIVHACSELGAEVVVAQGRGESVITDTSALVSDVKPTHIIVGPGPGWPRNSPTTMNMAKAAVDGELKNKDGNHIPLLGVCLGLQALGEAVGWKLTPSHSGAVHGYSEPMSFGQDALLAGITENSRMMRYHSLSLQPMNDSLGVIVTDRETRSLVMAVNHPTLPVWGVQFHPESSGSKEGSRLLENFLSTPLRLDGQSVEMPLAGRGD